MPILPDLDQNLIDFDPESDPDPIWILIKYGAELTAKLADAGAEGRYATALNNAVFDAVFIAVPKSSTRSQTNSSPN